MQIQDYLYAIRRRLWLPIAVPVAAAVVAAGVLYIQPEKFQATATVIVPALSGQGYSTSAVTQYVSTFKDVLISAPVVDYVSLLTGDKRSELVAGLTASTATASSNVITVTYTGPNRKTVTAVAEAAAMQTLDVLIGPSKARADQEVSTSTAALNNANKAILDYTTQTGYPDPDNDYKNKSVELSQLSTQLQEATLVGDQARIKALTLIIGQRNAELIKLATFKLTYDNLLQQQTAAESVLNKALEDQNKIQAELASDHDASAVSYRFVGHVSRVPDMLKFGGIALAIALALTIGFIVFMEFYRPAVAQLPYLRRLAIPARLAPSEAPANGNGNGAAVAAEANGSAHPAGEDDSVEEEVSRPSTSK